MAAINLGMSSVASKASIRLNPNDRGTSAKVASWMT